MGRKEEGMCWCVAVYIWLGKGLSDVSVQGLGKRARRRGSQRTALLRGKGGVRGSAVQTRVCE